MARNWRSILTAVVLAAGASVPVLLAVEASREPACDRGCLLDFTNQYLNAMLAHDPSGLRVASDLTTTENGKPLRLGEGLWTTAKAISVQQSFADAAAGETGSFGVVQKESGERNRFALRVKVEHQQIVEVEILVE